MLILVQCPVCEFANESDQDAIRCWRCKTVYSMETGERLPDDDLMEEKA